MFLIEKIKNSFFPFYKSDKIKKIFYILNSENKNHAMFVGGCVRKHFLKEKIDDIDIATSLTPNEISKKFQNSNIQVKETGVDHGTLTLIFEGQKFEITTLRKDILTDGRHAKIEFTENWTEDSKRRDFTINAIYLDQKGKIFDPQLGLEDLKNKRVKFIGDPNQRIKEDFLRILRFIRFSIQYQSFEISEEVKKAIKVNLNGIIKLSKERVLSELEKIIKLRNFYDLFKNEFILEIFKLIFPEFKHLPRIKKLKKLYKFNDVKPEKDIIFASMLLDSSNNHEYFFHKYKVSNQLKSNINLFSKVLKETKSYEEFFTKNLKKNIFFYGKDNMKKIFIIFNLVNKKNFNSNRIKTLSQINKSVTPKMPITGNDLFKYGFKSGKKMGQALKKIEKKWIENNFVINDSDIKALIKKLT